MFDTRVFPKEANLVTTNPSTTNPGTPVTPKSDADGPKWPDARIAEAFDVSTHTVARLRHRCVFEGLEAAIARRPPSATRPRRLDGAAEARLVLLACSTPPEGSAKWTMQLLADQLVTLEIVGEICGETVRKTLKKTNSSRGVKRGTSSRPRPTPNSSARCRVRLLKDSGP